MTRSRVSWVGWPLGLVRGARLHGQKNSSCSPEELPLLVEALESSLPEEDESGVSAVKDTGEMVCIETANAASDTVTVQPGASTVLGTRISLEND